MANVGVDVGAILGPGWADGPALEREASREVIMDLTDLELLSRAVERLMGRETFAATLERLENELSRSDRTFVWESVDLGSVSCELPEGIRSCWVFHLRRDVPSGAHYHPNSVQHMAMIRGKGTSSVGGVLSAMVPFASPEASLADRWLIIAQGVPHEFTPDGGSMTVVSFHTCHADELVEIDCETGAARFYEVPDA